MLPVKLIALKSNVSAVAFTFFVFYVTPRVESLSYLTLSKPWQAHHKKIISEFFVRSSVGFVECAMRPILEP